MIIILDEKALTGASAYSLFAANVRRYISAVNIASSWAWLSPRTRVSYSWQLASGGFRPLTTAFNDVISQMTRNRPGRKCPITCRLGTVVP